LVRRSLTYNKEERELEVMPPPSEDGDKEEKYVAAKEGKNPRLLQNPRFDGQNCHTHTPVQCNWLIISNISLWTLKAV
jgi:hypothetical protein